LQLLAFSTTPFHLTRSCLHFVKLFVFTILKSSCISFSHLTFRFPTNTVDIGPQAYNFLDHLRYTWPNQLNLWTLTQLVILLFPIRLLNSSFVLILDIPSLSLVGPNIFFVSFFHLLMFVS
jgi:hypothetical protein